ncbi:hypothetical protein [Bradyrhizobium sp. RDM4]|uniref:hypothetical protein n=1 Tax=Bradyrhizobium sp. RDM4 TaxID=3378765 RepID=UPI0038FBF2D4
MVGTAQGAFADPTASPMPRYFAGLSSARADARKARRARRSAKRSIIWLIKPRAFFFGVVPAGARRAGGEIFSNVNAGIVYPLAVE